MVDAPIGIFDSGVGGLSILFEIERRLPGEHRLYYADSARCPWGGRPAGEIRELAAEATARLIAEGAKLVVVACNSASTVALADLRRRFAVPIVGTVPAIKPAGLATRTGRIAVLGTAATVGTAEVDRLIAEFAGDHRVYRIACPDHLVELIEAGAIDTRETDDLLGSIIQPLIADGVDTIVLGCTHYPFLRPAIERLAGPGAEVIDTGAAIARQVRRVIVERGLAREATEPGRTRLRSSGDATALAAIVDRLRSAYRPRCVPIS